MVIIIYWETFMVQTISYSPNDKKENTLEPKHVQRRHRIKKGGSLNKRLQRKCNSQLTSGLKTRVWIVLDFCTQLCRAKDTSVVLGELGFPFNLFYAAKQSSSQPHNTDGNFLVGKKNILSSDLAKRDACGPWTESGPTHRSTATLMVL